MRPRLVNDPYHNPFRNRFNVPVHSRLDEMQAYRHMAWLRDQTTFESQTDRTQHARYWGRALAGAFALLLVVVVSAALISN